MSVHMHTNNVPPRLAIVPRALERVANFTPLFLGWTQAAQGCSQFQSALIFWVLLAKSAFAAFLR